jgi:mannuronan 5-epimerase
MLVLVVVLSLWLLPTSSVVTFGQRSLSSSGSAACISYSIYNNTITVRCNANLSNISQVVNDRSVLEKDPEGVWILNAIIKVNPHAMLTIDRTDTSWLKITNRIFSENESNFITISGSAKIDGVKITSWDPFSDDVIRQKNKEGSAPRPYILIDRGARSVNVSNSEFAFLGYSSFPSNGFVYNRGGNNSNVVNNKFHDMWDGFYSDSAGFITIKNNKYYNNLRYGIDPHTKSHDLNIIGNTAYNNSNIGIICSENCYNILFDNNTVHNNGKVGLMFSLDTNNSTARKNYAYNEKAGFSIFSSSNDKVYNNIVNSSHTGISVGNNSSDNHIYNNTIMNTVVGINFPDSNPKNNLIENNNLTNIVYPTMIKGTDNIGRNNSVYNK